jgi:O-antigen/teichoic acid export membrane protein
MDHADGTLTDKAVSGGLWMSGFQIARQLLQFLSVSILAHRVPPAAYGVVAMAVVVTNLLETVRDLGTGEALVREQEMSHEIASTAWWLNLGMGGVVALLIVVSSWPAAAFFREPLLAPVLQSLSLMVLLTAISVVPRALLVRDMAFRRLAVTQTAGAMCGTTAAIAVAYAGGGLWSLVTGGLTTSLITTVAVVFLSPFRVRALFRVHEARRMLSFGLYLSGAHVFNYFSRNIDNLLVGRFLGSVQLGYYQMGYLLMTYPLQNMIVVVTEVMYPAMARFTGDIEKTRNAYLRSCRYIALITFPLMLGLVVTARPFIHVFLGARWMPVARLLMVFAPLGAAQALYATVDMIYKTQDKTNMQFRWTVLSSVAYVLSFAYGLKWGIAGVATCYAGMWFLLMAPSFWIPFRLIHLSDQTFFQAVWPTLWMSLLMAVLSGSWLRGLTLFGMQSGAVALGSTVSVGAATYAALLLWKRPPVLFDLKGILSSASNPLLRKSAVLLNRAMSGTPECPRPV